MDQRRIPRFCIVTFFFRHVECIHGALQHNDSQGKTAFRIMTSRR
jgi:hypothetical protein